MDPVRTTPPPTPNVSLTDTYWKLLEVSGQPVAVAEQMREPQLVLNSQDGRFAGSGGVNRLMGGYALDGASLTFSQVASTMMAGPPEAMAQEQAIVAALGNVRGYAISGDQLTLVDAAGQPVLKAVAVALR
jgi:heat shock protein HslJ